MPLGAILSGMFAVIVAAGDDEEAKAVDSGIFWRWTSSRLTRVP